MDAYTRPAQAPRPSLEHTPRPRLERKPRPRPVTPPLAVAWLLLACTVFEPVTPDPGEELSARRAAWDAMAIDDYIYTANMLCYCPPDLLTPVLLEVVDGRIVAAADVETGEPVPVTTMAGQPKYYTVHELFEVIERAIAHGARLDVEYDPELHYPRYINTWISGALDSQFTHNARDLAPL
jgi:hypothetical protein